MTDPLEPLPIVGVPLEPHHFAVIHPTLLAAPTVGARWEPVDPEIGVTTSTDPAGW